MVFLSFIHVFRGQNDVLVEKQHATFDVTSSWSDAIQQTPQSQTAHECGSQNNEFGFIAQGEIDDAPL